MKKIVFMIAVFAASVGVSQATILNSNDESTVVTLDEKVKIKPEELPDAVKESVNKTFAGWTITAAYKYTETETFEVEVKNGAETKSVKFDKEGNEVE